jgi:hypothetical protein
MARFHSVETLKGDMSGVQYLYTREGLGPLPRGDLFATVKTSLEAVMIEADKPKPAHAFSVADLLAIREVLDLTRHDHATFWAMVVVAFWGLLRVDTFTGVTLFSFDVTVHDSPDFVSLFIRAPKGKTRSYYATLAARSDGLCPVWALANMFAVSGCAGRGFLSPLFVSAAGSPISGDSFNLQLKRAVAVALPFLPLDRISAHGLRRGGFTCLTRLGVPYLAIKAHGGWVSDAAMLYYDRDSAASRLLPTLLAADRAGAAPALAREQYSAWAPLPN